MDLSGFVDLGDIGPFVDSLFGTYQFEADMDDNGVVDLGDINLFVTRLFEGPPPRIVRFFHNAGTVTPGSQVLLEWETSNASTLTLSEGIGDVSGQSSILIDAPQETTTYTLTATRGSQTIQEDLRLIVGVPRPNIVLCLVDDWGVMDTSVPFSYDNYEDGAQPVVRSFNEFYQTPNMEQLAADGMIFSQAYAQPVCSPCLLYTSPSPRDATLSRMPSSA